MRILFSTTAGAGHFGPMVPFARAAQQSGHDVAVAAPTSFATAVGRAGFEHRPFADADPEALGKVFARLPGLPEDEASAIVASEVFAGIDAQAARPGIAAIVDAWHPDLIVRDPTEFGSFAVAQERSVPCARVAIGLSWFEERFTGDLDAPLAELGCESAVQQLREEPAFSLLPESFEDPSTVGPPSMGRYRAPATAAMAEPMPDWWPGSDDPFVYVTFGSVAASHPAFAPVYQQVVPALADRPARILLTTGEAADLDGLGPIPSNVHVETWWPQEQAMAHASAMVGHGGFGTTLLALAAGIPQVVVPLFADQPHNARRVAEVGAGVAVDGGISAVASQLWPAVDRVLGDHAIRAGARRLAADIAALPPVADAVPVLEGLV